MWKERAKLGKQAKAGDRWRQIKSGRIAVVVAPVDDWGCITLKHENGRTTRKWMNYFGQEFEPESSPNGT
jgi:hypothetical protein